MRLEIRHEQKTVFTWECPLCHKPLQSLYKAQLVNNAQEHMKGHETE